MATQDYTEYPAKAPTALQSNMAEWLTGEEVGADPTTCKNKQEAFELGVKLGVALRIQYQKSDFNQGLRTEAAEKREQAVTEKATSKAAGKKAKAKAEVAEEADEDEAEDEPEEKPAKKAAKKAAAAKKPAKKAAKKAAAKAAEDEDDEDDEF